jgi:hypothetical protein
MRRRLATEQVRPIRTIIATRSARHPLNDLCPEPATSPSEFFLDLVLDLVEFLVDLVLDLVLG